MAIMPSGYFLGNKAHFSHLPPPDRHRYIVGAFGFPAGVFMLACTRVAAVELALAACTYRGMCLWNMGIKLGHESWTRVVFVDMAYEDQVYGIGAKTSPLVSSSHPLPVPISPHRSKLSPTCSCFAGYSPTWETPTLEEFYILAVGTSSRIDPQRQLRYQKPLRNLSGICASQPLQIDRKI